MAASFSSKASSNPTYNTRSISFPARSHPTIRRLEAELIKLATSCESPSTSSKSDTICAAISGLGLVYGCIDNLLSLPQTQQSLHQYREGRLVNIVLDDLIMYLDACNVTRDAFLLIKEAIRELQSALRRSKSGPDHAVVSIEDCVASYFASRKKVKKMVAKCFASLKQVDKVPRKDHVHAHPLEEASSITILVLASLLSFLSLPVHKPKTTKTRWSLVSRLVMYRGDAAYEGDEGGFNEMASVDFALANLLASHSSEEGGGSEAEKVDIAQVKMEALEKSVQALEAELECLFKGLIQARVALLNILSS